MCLFPASSLFAGVASIGGGKNDKRCLESSKFGRPEIKDCTENYQIIERITEDQVKLKSKIQENLKKVPDAAAASTDMDKGAQCALYSANSLAKEQSIPVAKNIDDSLGRLKHARSKVDSGVKSLKSLAEAMGPLRCVGSCEQQPGMNRGACGQKCNINPANAGQWEKAVGIPLSQLAQNPAPADERIFGAAKEFKALDNLVKREMASLNELNNSLQASMRKIDTFQQAAKGKYDCKTLTETADASSRYAENKHNRGTGFYVKTVGPDGKEKYTFVTAEHVADEAFADPTKISLEKTKTFVPGEVGDTKEFEVKPGSIHKGADLISTPAGKKSDALAVVSSDRQPEVGQEFKISGYPAVAGQQFTSHNCTFLGYVPGLHGSEPAYYMDCPTVETSSMAGMSGGPMVDSSGTVWGVVSAQTTTQTNTLGGGTKVSSPRMIIAPISADSSGSLRHGVQDILLTPNCYDKKTNTNYKCQLIPGMTYSTQ
jgi:S1-C subfamily serine protease